MIPANLDRLVDVERGVVSRRIFADEDIHRLEQERLFRRTWCFVGHESLIPTTGSYITTYIGEDPIIVWRDEDSRIRAFLNTCPHRGNKLCLFHQGQARTVQCIYHGWTFNSKGELVGVPFLERAYYNELDRAANGLLEVPRVQSYGGLIFACWDPGAISLESHLGELRWWLDAFLCSDDFGGLAALPGCQRYRMAGNWKINCDNFIGDRYHTNMTHASAIKLGMARKPPMNQGNTGYFMTFLEPAHGLGGFYTDTTQLEADLERAKSLGTEVVEYVQERAERMRARMSTRDKPTHFSFGLGFPNFLLQGVGRAFQGNLVGVCHPRGVHECEVEQWVLMERQAPRVVKELGARFVSRAQSAAGLIGVDDGENFERITENTRSPMSSKLTFNYSMGIEHEGRWPGSDTWQVNGLPGIVGPEFWEVSQRRFYARWAELMAAEGT